MKRGKRIKLKYKKERVLLSDVLPYELPIIMSNRMLYRFCVKQKVTYCIQNNILSWDKNINSESFEIVKLLFGPALKSNVKPEDGEALLSEYSTIPFTFHILHKETEYRSLSIVHPALQIRMVDFYEVYKHLILHYCGLSNYSLRYPSKVASFFFYKDKLHDSLLGVKKDTIELFFNEYENLKTFFSYKKYTQIYKFYDDYRFQRAEKKFGHLLKFDLQRCFDSIYTHSIAWATQGGKDVYKRYFKGRDKTSFGGIFDTLMQRLNYNETNGIVIGPEFSRIFAEIILQHIDKTAEHLLNEGGYVNGVDYQMYRYVDDYFLFYNDEKIKIEILQLFHKLLEEYKLKISREKTVDYCRPFITNISRAKLRIDNLINHWFKFRASRVEKLEEFEPELETKDSVKDELAGDDDSNQLIPDEGRILSIVSEKGYFPLVSRKFNQEYKDALISADVAPKDVLNYSLSCIFSRLERELKKFDKKFKFLKLSLMCGNSVLTADLKDAIRKKITSMESQMIKYLIEVIDVSFFLFSLNKRLNSTLKLMRILNVILVYIKGYYKSSKPDCKVVRFTINMTEPVIIQIYQEVKNALLFSQCQEYAQLEVLYLLIIMRQIRDSHPIPPDIISRYLNLDKNRLKLNAISFNVTLYYIGNVGKYEGLKRQLVENIKSKLRAKGDFDYSKDSESVIFAIDLACCPYLKTDNKREILQCMNFSRDMIDNLLCFGKKTKSFFTKWNGVNVTKELAAKISQEVYS